MRKCPFNIKCILLPGFIRVNKNVEIEKNCISTILNLLDKESVFEIQTLLEYINFYLRLCQNFSENKTHTQRHDQKQNAKKEERSSVLVTDFLISEACRSHKELVATFTSLFFCVFLIPKDK